MGDRENTGEEEIRFDWPIDLRLTVMSHGWAQLAPWAWDRERLRLARSERIGGSVGTIAAEQLAPQGSFIMNGNLTLPVLLEAEHGTLAAAA